MGRYLITWTNAEGVHEMTFDDYQSAMDQIAFMEDVASNISFTTLQDPDDAREEQWYDGQ